MVKKKSVRADWLIAVCHLNVGDVLIATDFEPYVIDISQKETED